MDPRALCLDVVPIGVEPLLTIGSGVGPPTGPAPPRAQDAGGFGNSKGLVDPMPRLGKADQVSAPVSKRQASPVGHHRRQTRRTFDGPLQEAAADVESDDA